MKKIALIFVFFPLSLITISFIFMQYRNGETKQNTDAEQISSAPVEIPIGVSSPPSPSTSIQPGAVSQINLTISSPDSGSVVEGPMISLIGKTSPGIQVVVNDQDLVSDGDGAFKATVSLDEGENYISVVAYDDFGNVAERELLVTRTVAGL